MRRFLPLLIATVFLTGCELLAPSLHPPATPEQLIVDPALAGHWRIDDDGSSGVLFVAPEQPDPWWRVEMLGESCDELDEESEFRVALTRIEGALFLILTEDDSDLLFSVPIYELMRADLTEDRLYLRGFDEDWLSQQFETDTEFPGHVWREELSQALFSSKTKPERALILTASTPELRAFYARHLNTEEAWGEVLPIVRLDEAAVAEFRAARQQCDEEQP
jgi:hypothetical protein